MLIQSTKDLSAGRAKVLIYGSAKAGKTHLAATYPEDKTLIISAEAGLLTLRKKNIAFVDMGTDDNGKPIPVEKRIDRLGEIYKYLLTDEAKNKYSYVVLDSLTEVSESVLQELRGKPEYIKNQQGMWGEYGNRVMKIAKLFRDLPHYGVAVIGHEEIEKDETNKRFTGLMISGKSKTNLIMVFDEIYYLTVAKADDGGLKRVLLTAKTDTITAGSRLGLPAVIENPNMSEIIGLQEGPKPESIKQLEKSLAETPKK